MLTTKQFNLQDYDIPELEYDIVGDENCTIRNAKIQTEQILTAEAETNTKRAGRTVKLQVEEQQIQTIMRGTQGSQQEGQEQFLQLDEEAEGDLSEFLKRVSPTVMQALEENIMSLDNYEPVWHDQRKENKIIYQLSNKSNRSNETINQLEITDISWSNNGFTLAAAYGKFQHSGTCQDKSLVCLWNLSKRDFQQDQPSQVLETDSCIMSVEFHPSKPQILVGGSFNGEIFLWDISKDDENLISKSNIDDYFHREAVHQFVWYEYKLQGQIQSVYNLLSLSTDGKVLLWEIRDEFNKQCLDYPLKGFSLVRKKDGAVSYVGGLCFAQALEDKNTFIIGSEAGSVLRGTFRNVNYDKRNKVLLEQSTSNLKWRSNTNPLMLNLENKYFPELKQYIENACKQRGYQDIDISNIFQSKPEMRKFYINPINFAYEQHFGPVYSISYSPFHRNLFLTSSIDGSIRLYDLLQQKPLLTIDLVSSYIFKVEWSQTRPTVFAAALSNGDLKIFDLSYSKKQPLFTIENNVLDQQALNLKFNKRQNDLLAVVYQKCVIKIYQLADKVCLPKKNEIQTLNGLCDDMKQVVN
ncbi:WD40-repeat-containing domain [Pseudocohnilembus persalinus]|uniref:WD40-repeat-containing domain n=1 Tax=Pseudocohnilembus persalinus TaxID=266149 RepID=A0A0V0QZ18_PSEPJ|nr:WD40-repeat-containing domain [Pseudocohnilembus persalinus]|eukprot:KRX07564.1 WD40-repeat-containing domain [Pseudocohnilembus persalinus]